MATKAKAKTKAKAQEQVNPADFAAQFFNAENIQENIQKATASFGEFGSFGKENVEAFVQSAQIAGEGIKTLGTETAAFNKETFENSAAAAKDAFSASSVEEFVEIQSSFNQSFFNAYVAQVKSVVDLVAETTNEAVKPLNAQANAFAAKVQNA